VLGGDAGDV